MTRNLIPYGAARLELGPYYSHLSESLRRTRNLLSKTRTGDQDVNDDIVRAIVVLTHAYLEDFLRTLARTLLPEASESVLNGIPLAGSSGRAEKFQLGALSRHRGRTVEQLIKDSVSEHLERSNFNSTTEIASFLNNIGVSLSAKATDVLPALDQMIQRRHLIVHRADRIKKANSNEYELQAIDHDGAVNWTIATVDFMTEIVRSFEPQGPNAMSALLGELNKPT